MQKILFIIGFITLTMAAIAQNETAINQKANFIDIDNQGNLYLVNETELLKYDLNGNLLYQYSNSFTGKISSIDVSNPLRILLFYNESNTLIFLNQQLSEITDPLLINANDGIEGIAASLSSEGGFWVFDAITSSMLFFDNNRIKQKQSENLSIQLKGETPLFLTEQNKLVYLQTQNNVLVFDIYANLMYAFDISSYQKIHFYQNKPYYFHQQIITIINGNIKTPKQIPLKQYDNAKSALLFKTMLILQINDIIKIINDFKVDE